MRKHFLFIIVIILLYSSASSLYSQNTFWTVIKDSLRDNVVWDGIEMYDGNNLLIDIDYSTHVRSKVIKLNSFGQTVSQRQINHGSDTCVLDFILKINPDRYLLNGSVTKNKKKYLWIYELDSNLNEIKSKVFQLGPYNLYNCKLLKDYNNIYCIGTVDDPDYTLRPYSYIFKFSYSLDSLQFKLFDQQYSLGQDLLKNNYSGLYYFFVLGYGLGGSKILRLDSTFNLIDVTELPEDLSNFNVSKWICNDRFIVTGEKEPPSGQDGRYIGTVIEDTSFNEIRFQYFGKQDTLNFPGFMKNLDFDDVNSIYIGGTANFNHFEFSSIDSWFSLYNVDTTLNLNWEKYYGGDGFYTLYSVCATSDGGCLMAGSMWDYHNISSYVRYPVIIKVDKTGFVSINDHEAGFQVKDAILYPNPGTDYFILKSGPQIKNSIFTLCDLQGRRVIRKVIDETSIRVNTANLPSGMYIWNISEEGKVIERGKWIKE